MSSTRPRREGPPAAPVAARAAATWFLDQKTLPRHGTVKGFEADFRQVLARLMPRVEHLAATLPADDVLRAVALGGVGEARRRLDEPEAAGLQGEVERVKRLARSVIALCGHLESLSGVRVCLLCGRPVEGVDA
ncbi:DUF6415 family natural product biosynthesis protein [Streptomyces thermodiastaticus]|uniref:DUF6415 family natural product biosynthesis protein n=1 Tax=Streptomyces thermodiastaticus TaxID=44061 RepID=UPI001679DD80|nr:DUF6415 family natural product biosynthesis protein [Streptomyces thermodiastaticus]MCE7553423.1 DUF6415 family natural product biosynthesis protein [Streptomyces thermodiastaticus]GHF96875.1 hypothetical protein GCM10018787_51850 [Streptomyces thermodiastaticus]